MKKVGLVLIAIILIVAGIALTQRSPIAQNSTTIKPRPIPELEAERLARETPGRGDTGRLTPEAFKQDRETFTTRTTLFVMENVKDSNISLPITGERAKIGVFSATDGNLNVQLSDPTGNDLPVQPHARNSNDENALNRVTTGRGNPKDGVLLIAERPQMTPGIYNLNVRQAASPIDIIVNDEGGPELNLWLSDNGRENKNGVTVFAKLVDGDKKITGAQLVAKIRGEKGSRIPLTETEPGIYSAVVKTDKLASLTTFIVEAKGNTLSGLQLQRNGSIDLIAGKANAKLVGIGKEELTSTDLTVEVNVKVSAAGRYYVRGNLLGTNDEPIAWAQDARELTPGQHTLTLHFSREVINQSGFSAGFKLSDVELMNTTEMPGIKASEKINDFFLKSSL